MIPLLAAGPPAYIQQGSLLSQQAVNPCDRTRIVVRVAMYALQTYDAFNSAKTFRLGGYETDPAMKPWSHGGAVSMLLGFGFGDLMRNLAMKRAHADSCIVEAGDVLQAAANVQGIIYTNSHR